MKIIKYTIVLLLSLFFLNIIPALQVATAQTISEDWPSFQYDIDHTGNNVAETSLKPPLTQLWTQTYDTSTIRSMVDANNMLYVKYYSGGLYALNDQTGSVLWYTQTNYGGAVTYANGIIYTASFCSSCGTWQVEGFDSATGKLLMQSDAVPGNIVAMTIANNVIYVGTADMVTTGQHYHTLTAFDATTGKTIWVDGTDDAVDDFPIVSNGVVYFGTYQGSMYAVNASNGSIIWQHGGIYAKSSPILQNGILYEGSGNEGPGGPFFALNAADGSTIWSNYGLTFGFYTSPAYANGIVYAESSGELGAFNATTGRLLWTQPIGFEDGNLVIANGTLYVESNSAVSPIAMYALDPNTGQVLWQFLSSSPLRSPIVANHTLYFASDSGTIYAFHDESYAPPTIQPIAVAPSSSILTGTTITASTQFTHPNANDIMQGNWNWGDGTSSPATLTTSAGTGSVSDAHTYTTAGVYTITLTITDTTTGGSANASYQYVTVYDSGSSFAGGRSFTSPPGAISSAPAITGKVTFGINAGYTKNNTLTGTVKMDFKTANLSFDATSLSYLVTTNGEGFLSGSGTLNGTPNYTFLVSGIDGSKANGTDFIRFQIIDGSGNVVYDSQPGANALAGPTTPVDTGNIRIN